MYVILYAAAAEERQFPQQVGRTNDRRKGDVQWQNVESKRATQSCNQCKYIATITLRTRKVVLDHPTWRRRSQNCTVRQMPTYLRFLENKHLQGETWPLVLGVPKLAKGWYWGCTFDGMTV